MTEQEQRKAREEQPILSARYSAFKAWGSIIVLLAFPLLLIFGVVYREFSRGDYLGAVLLSLVCLCVLLFVLDALFFKEMTFYGDRVTKSWHLFGSRTVYYTSGAVKRPEWYMKWVSSGHFIVQVRGDGRPVPMRLPIMYIAFFFPADTEKEIAQIMDYLSEDTINNWRTFKKATLREEVIWRSQQLG